MMRFVLWRSVPCRWLVLPVLLALAFAGCGGGQATRTVTVVKHRPARTTTSDTAGYSAAERSRMARALRILDAHRNMNTRQLVLLYTKAQGPQSVRCGVGLNADFPNIVIVTVFSPDGSWVQASIDPSRPYLEASNIRHGDDYNVAFGESGSDFLANLEPCHMNEITYFVLG